MSEEIKTKEHDRKVKQFLAKDGKEAFSSKTPMDELPIIFAYGSSSSSPERIVKMKTADLVLWVKFLDAPMFMPYGKFSYPQIIKMLEICNNDTQILSLMELLSAKKE
jgi:hypothetical protein